MQTTKRTYAGMLRGKDAREWKHYWTVRGHIAILEATGRKGYFHCWLTLKIQEKS